MIYHNVFTGVLRKYENGKGFVFSNVNEKWIETNAQEELIKALPYYKTLEKGVPVLETNNMSVVMSAEDKILLEKMLTNV